MQTGGSIVTRGDSVPFNNLGYLYEVASAFSIDLDSLLPAELRQLDSDTEEIPAAAYYALIEKLLATGDIPALGARLGAYFSLADYGVLGYACICCPTIGQSINTFLQFQQLAGSEYSFQERLRIDNQRASIQIHPYHANPHLNRFDCELACGQWVSAGKAYLNGSNMFSAIHFRDSKPDYYQELESVLQCPLQFDQGENELIFDASVLQKPLSMANSITAELCRQQCETLLQNLKSQGGLAEQVRHLIIHQPGQQPDPDNIARQLNLSYRTLRRRLQEEGTSFKALHDEVRMNMAQEYLRGTQLSTQEIAHLLGYAEVTNFHRAFKRWYDCTPGDYRDRQADGQ